MRQVNDRAIPFGPAALRRAAEDRALGGRYVAGSPGIGASAVISCMIRGRAPIEKMAARIDYVVGASVFVPRQFLDEIGLMSEDHFLFFEELDWAVRAKGRYRLALAPDSLVYHKGESSLEKKEKEEGLRPGHFSPLFDRYITRNRLLLPENSIPTPCLSFI